ncbi:uncharacterized protein LOC135121980 [Zophobas morio]|uniref:uncharacterized protein LOC135121980 n=1 Tax=Zophobas morio TaxID=2755281 RepID=UPI003082A2ED
MGPFKTLMSFGAHVIAINSQRPETWKRLIEITRASSGTLTFPLSVEQNDMNDEMLCEKAGCDLLTQTPEIKNWLNEVYPDKEFIIGSYSYLDGEAYVRVSLAMDAILMQVCSKRKIKGIAYLNTPTLCYLIPNEAAQASVNNYYKPSIFNTIMMPLRLLAPRLADRNIRTTATTEDGKKEYIVNGLVLAQGPNYALAKSIQLWRSIIAKEKGFLVSSNIAPATKTVSVVHNRKFAWAYNGYHYFEPIEIFEPETSSALMCALLINDINNEDSCSSPKKILPQLWDLFKDGALHGGVWRSGYSLQSTGEIAALMYFYEKLKPFLVVLFALFASVYFTTSSKSA